MNHYKSKILCTGSYLPGDPVPNASLTQFPISVLPLIEQKAGVGQRHFAAPNETTSDLASRAIAVCLESAAISLESVDALLLATSSPDHILPPTAAIVQQKAGLSRAFACDLNSVCSGALFALHMADGLICAGLHSRVLVVAAETYSRICNPLDIATYPYFGDGAGAVLLARADKGEGAGLGVCCLHTDGAGAETIIVPAGGARQPGWSNPPENAFYFHMKGREVFEFAVAKGSEVIQEVLDAEGIDKDAVDVVIVHQANINIINRISEVTQIPREKFFVNLHDVGNTAGASVLIALDMALRHHRIQPGYRVVLAGFGGGLSWGAMTMQF